MQIGISTSISQLRVGAAAPAAPWLINGGVWNDAGVWDDTATWDDGGVSWTNPNLATASYDSVSFSVASQDNNPRSVAFSSNGSKMFVLGTTADSIYQYSLSTSWDPSSATYDSSSFSVGTQETSPNTIVFKSDGTSFYITGYSNSVYQYDLTTAYDLSTASYASKSLSTGLTNATGLSISTDGTKLWAVDTGGTIQQFTMSTAWDVSTASSDSKSLDVSARGATTTGLYVSNDGSAAYITNLGTDTIYEYDLSTTYDISTGTYSSVSFSVATEETNPWGFTFKNDGSKMYAIGNIADSVLQYST
jgi:sugar lactone lactonase YvrE